MCRTLKCKIYTKLKVFFNKYDFNKCNFLPFLLNRIMNKLMNSYIYLSVPFKWHLSFHEYYLSTLLQSRFLLHQRSILFTVICKGSNNLNSFRLFNVPLDNAHPMLSIFLLLFKYTARLIPQ